MKILVYGINYAPELTGIGKYTGEMCEWFASRGHQVEVITAMPYYPEWKINEKYKNRWWHTEIKNGVKILRTPFYVPVKVTAVSRILHEMSFIAGSLYFWLPRFFRKYDMVIGICPPLQAGVLPMLYKFIRRKPFVFHIQDLQVDMAKELGLIKNKLLLNFLERTEKFLMRRATRVSIINQGMKKRLLQKGVKEEKIFLFPNWVDTDFIKPMNKVVPLKTELGFELTDKIILYSGSMGKKQGLEMIINIAEKLKNHASLFFVFCGEGAAKRDLQGLAREKALSNVRFFGLQPYEKLNELLAMGDIHLVLEKKAASDLVFPSKLMAILAAGRLALVTAAHNTGLYNMINDNKLAIPVDPENEKVMEITLLENLDKDHSSIRENARNFAVRELSIDKILPDFELTLLELDRMYKLPI